MNIKTYLQKEKARLEKDISIHEKYLTESPTGTLIVKKVGGHFAWMIKEASSGERDLELGKDVKDFKNCKKNNIKNNIDSNIANNMRKSKENRKSNSNLHYIKKENESLAQKLAAKGYVEALLKDERADLKATNAYLKYCTSDVNRNKYLAKNEEYQRLLKPYIAKYDTDVEAWLKDKYTGPVPHPENLRIPTQAGFKVRSKSEERIVSLLIKHNIRYKYEEHLVSNGHDIFPDFTIMNQRTHKIYIWEHLGMMDDYAYRKRNLEKIQDYAPLGYYPGENLILTYETKNSAIDVIWFEKVIEHYFK